MGECNPDVYAVTNLRRKAYKCQADQHHHLSGVLRQPAVAHLGVADKVGGRGDLLRFCPALMGVAGRDCYTAAL